MAVPQPPQQQGFDISRLYVWVRGLESKINNISREVNVIKNDFIKRQNNTKRDLREISKELIEIKREQARTDQRMDLIIKELKKTAGEEEVMTLKKYLEFWSPLNFVTQRDVERILETKFKEMKSTVRVNARRKRVVKKKKKHK